MKEASRGLVAIVHQGHGEPESQGHGCEVDEPDVAHTYCKIYIYIFIYVRKMVYI